VRVGREMCESGERDTSLGRKWIRMHGSEGDVWTIAHTLG
jgi:hypothetical protein